MSKEPWVPGWSDLAIAGPYAVSFPRLTLFVLTVASSSSMPHGWSLGSAETSSPQWP